MGPKAAKERYVNETAWMSRVQVPACLVVGSMNQLSEWGTAMGVSTIGCWGFVLGLLPRATSTLHPGLTTSLPIIAVLPLMIAWAPATVSSACDDLLNQLTDISFLGDPDHKDRCQRLQSSLTSLNRGQGLVRHSALLSAIENNRE